MRARTMRGAFALVDAVLAAWNLIAAVQLMAAGAYVRATVSAVLALWMALLFTSDVRIARAAS